LGRLGWLACSPPSSCTLASDACMVWVGAGVRVRARARARVGVGARARVGVGANPGPLTNLGRWRRASAWRGWSELGFGISVRG
jgi:hypothetical protein